MRLLRKVKKHLKRAILKDIDPRWETSEVRIDSVEHASELRYRRPTHANRYKAKR